MRCCFFLQSKVEIGNSAIFGLALPKSEQAFSGAGLIFNEHLILKFVDCTVNARFVSAMEC